MSKQTIINLTQIADQIFGGAQEAIGRFQNLSLRARVRDADGLETSALTAAVSTRELHLIGSAPVGVGEVVVSLELDESGLFPVRFKGKCLGGHVCRSGRIQFVVDISSSSPRALKVLDQHLEDAQELVS